MFQTTDVILMQCFVKSGYNDNPKRKKSWISWPRIYTDRKAKYSWQEADAVHMVGPACCDLLEAVETE